MLTRLDYFRLAAAGMAVAISCVICYMRGHLHVNASDPRTYLSPLQHKCGLLMTACLCWLVVETVRLATSGAAFGPVRPGRN